MSGKIARLNLSMELYGLVMCSLRTDTFNPLVAV